MGVVSFRGSLHILTQRQKSEAISKRKPKAEIACFVFQLTLYQVIGKQQKSMGMLRDREHDHHGLSVGFVPLVVRSPFRAKHHVVMQYMAAGPKCPLPPLDRPPPARPPMARPPHSQTPHGNRQHDWWRTRRTRKNLMNKEELTLYQRCKGLLTAVALSTASCFQCGASRTKL